MTAIDEQVGAITVRYYAAAAAAAVPEERIGLDGPTAIGTVLDRCADTHGPALAEVLRRCSFLLDEVAVHGLQTTISPGQALDVLPPFAGG